MDHKFLDSDNQKEITALFTSTFTSSEGEKEGALIGELVSALSSKIDNQEIFCLATCEKESILGSIFFTRLQCREFFQIYMLAPVAVSTQYQGKGVGQALIHYGLSELKKRSVGTVITYGDPSFYARVGFQPLSENVIPAPLKLSMPEGWLGQSLTEAPIPYIKERPSCVKAFNDPAYW